jgi:hypothetical protein
MVRGIVWMAQTKAKVVIVYLHSIRLRSVMVNLIVLVGMMKIHLFVGLQQGTFDVTSKSRIHTLSVIRTV